jgi:hypothetical protein
VAHLLITQVAAVVVQMQLQERLVLVELAVAVMALVHQLLTHKMELQTQVVAVVVVVRLMLIQQEATAVQELLLLDTQQHKEK